MDDHTALPPVIQDVEQLDELLSRPTPAATATMAQLEGDLLILGVGGKIGPSLARLARRASEAAGVSRRIIGVARFSSPGSQQQLESHGIETIRCDLLDRAQLSALPEAANVLYLAAMKFGSTGQEATAWAKNAYLPGMVCERYRNSRIVAYSTGNVYPLVSVSSKGSRESDVPIPIGEYAMSCLGRERIFSYFSEQWKIPTALIRLNYACEMRYGVLVDLARRVLADEPIDLTMGHFNVIWQGDNNAITLSALRHVSSPPTVFNVTGSEILTVRDVAEEFGKLMNKQVHFTGEEAEDALLANASLAHRQLGLPTVDSRQMIRWIADWCSRGGPTLGKPTHFQVRNGLF